MHHPGRARSVRPALAVVAAVVVLVVASCDTGPSSTDEPAAIGGRVVAEGFVLEVRLPTRTFAPTDAIPVTTTLTWTGGPDRGRIWGSGGGPVSFTFTEVGGARRMMGGVMTADCKMKEFAPGVATVIPLGKSASWTDEDPNAAFYQAWFREPVLRLPTGRWQLRVSVGGLLAPCELGAKTIEAAVGPIDLVIR